MPTMPVPIICGDKIKKFSDYEDAVPVNMIAIARDIEGSSGYLYSHDGLTQIRTGQGIDRGAIYNERMQRMFRVSGERLIEITDTSTTVIGTVPGTDLVATAYSFNSILVLASNRAFRFNGATFSEITDPDLGSPIDATYIDGYYFFTDGEYLYHTDINDETSIDPLKFATAEISPDPTKAVARTQDDLVAVFGRYTTEYFINQGNEQFAFTRLNQKAINSGIVGTHCWCEMDGNIYTLGGRKDERISVHALGVGQTLSVATRYVDSVIAQYTELELASAKLECRISDKNQLLYVRLPNETLVYNRSIAKVMGDGVAWSRLESNGAAWTAANIIFDPKLNLWVGGDFTNDRICKLDIDTAAQYGQPVDSYFYTPFVPIEAMSVDQVELNTVSGFVDQDTTLFISTTRDGAQHSQEWSKEVSVVQEYDQRYIPRRLGYVRKKIGFKFRSHHKEKLNVSGLMVTYG